MDEQVDVIDEEDKVIGQEFKLIVHQQGLGHRVSAVLLQREDGKYLIPTAAKIKVDAGGLYHSAAGHIPAGESYEDAARRELLEETGVTAESLELVGTFWFVKEYPTRKVKERFAVFKVQHHQGMGGVQLNEEQINEQWLDEKELKTIFVTDPARISAPLQMTCKTLLKFDE